jgi:hypothetical protein
MYITLVIFANFLTVVLHTILLLAKERPHSKRLRGIDLPPKLTREPRQSHFTDEPWSFENKTRPYLPSEDEQRLDALLDQVENDLTQRSLPRQLYGTTFTFLPEQNYNIEQESAYCATVDIIETAASTTTPKVMLKPDLCIASSNLSNKLVGFENQMFLDLLNSKSDYEEIGVFMNHVFDESSVARLVDHVSGLLSSDPVLIFHPSHLFEINYIIHRIGRRATVIESPLCLPHQIFAVRRDGGAFVQQGYVRLHEDTLENHVRKTITSRFGIHLFSKTSAAKLMIPKMANLMPSIGPVQK